HLDTAITLNNFGNAYYKKRDYAESLTYHKKSLKIRQKQSSNDHTDIAAKHNDIVQSLINIADVLLDQDELNTALEFYSQVLTIQKRDFDPRGHDDLVARLSGSNRVV
ncbi:unnamed protein product, partial [Didymodactylos carnosus]